MASRNIIVIIIIINNNNTKKSAGASLLSFSQRFCVQKPHDPCNKPLKATLRSNRHLDTAYCVRGCSRCIHKSRFCCSKDGLLVKWSNKPHYVLESTSGTSLEERERERDRVRKRGGRGLKLRAGTEFNLSCVMTSNSVINLVCLTFIDVRDKITDRQDCKRHAAGDTGLTNSFVTLTSCVYGLMWENEGVTHLQ
jgi:hypothetical protein